MWKVLLFVACVVGLTVATCDVTKPVYKCPPNEVFSNCTNGGCEARNCSQAGKPVPCVKLDPKYCIKGCVCQPGYLRLSNGTCVPQNECNEGCGDDPNAHPGCGVNCGRTCSTYKKKDVACILICYLNGCDCNDGYVYDPNVKKCVLPEDCITCGINEVYDVCPAPCPPRRCDVDDRLIRCAAPPQPGDPECKPGCRCADGYARNATGTCVLREQCEQPLTCDQPNEIYDPCPAPCPGYRCDVDPRLVFCPRSPQYGDPRCKPACRCIDGYARDADKKCIPRDQCPPICGLNEVPSNCTNGGCDARNCSQAGKPVPCVKLDPNSCIKGCVCLPGYLRLSNGTCVPQNECNEGCGDDPNAHPGCGVNCGRTCSTYKTKPVLCPLICNLNGCDCNEGYVFDPNIQKCVLPENCTPTCGLNEVFSSCANAGCGHRNCSQLGKPELCIDILPEFCTKGCICASGYLRGDNGTCVPKDKCGCGNDPNAHPGCGVNCGKTCSTYKIKNVPCPAICKLNGCDCNEGYVFDPNVKKCVLPENCTPTCGLNEVYSSCANAGCGHRNCSQLGKPKLCIDVRPEFCTKGCICAPGHLRTDNGTCVPEDKCGCGNDPNAHRGCGANCGKTCSTYKIKNVPCPAICNLNGCDCNDGYVFDPYVKKCVLPENCITCGINEVYDVCPAPCPPRRCDVDDRLIRCIAPPKPGDPACKPGCRCADGYARNATGTCVLREQCEPRLNCDQPNEIYDSCPALCPGDSCAVNPALVLCAPSPEYGDPDCRPACRCIDGYARNAANECVPRDQCPSKKCPGQNEFLDTCISGCSNQSCDSIGKIIHCPIQPAVCRTGCRCKPGFYRNASNVCVPESECPTPPCPDGEVYSRCPTVKCDADYCPKNRNSPNTCPVGIVCDPPRCVCGPLDRRDRKTGKCIRADKCPPFKCNGPNEEYQSCPATCPGEKCTDYINKSKCPPFRIGKVVACKPQCRCKKGYYRNSDGICILASRCVTCGINEVYDVCPAPCPPRRCDVDDRLIDCVPPPQPGDPACKPGCRCADGYARNATGTCVLREQCEPRLNCDQPNELYDSCPAPCPGDSCAVNPALVLCQRSPQYGDPECKPACRCIDGYARNAANECVPRDQCPSKECPGQNEFLDTCISGCSNQSCDSIGKIIHCPLQPAVCRTGCRCKPGFYRNASNVCVPESQCPTPPCPDGEVYSRCPTVRCDADYCPKNRNSPDTCPVGIVCDPPRCVCGPLDRRDRKTGKCIRADKCPPFKCNGPNEEYQSCPATCPGENCTDYKSKCPPFRIGKVVACKPQCRCKKGYYRNSDGICILASRCVTCGINEVYDVCPAPCPPRRCDVDDRLIRCAAPPQPGDPECKPGCRCADGYARNATGTCVLREQCEPRLNCDQPNELYDSCPAPCPGDSCAVDPALVLCAPSPQYGDPECKPACRCIDGYARNAANECVPRDQCPSKECPGQNEFLDTCISGCSNQSCDSIGKIFNCPLQPAVCRTGCRCKPGFYRNASNVCVPESQCPTPPCPDGEVYSRCPTVRCEADYCPKNRNSPQTCPVGIVCDPPRCVCGPLDRRDRKTGKCIRANKCPPFKCNGPNEEYQSCPATCPGEKCTDYINNSKCPRYKIGIVVACKPQCRCKKGYYRNSDGICILASRCECITNTTPKTPVIITDATTAKPPTTVPGDDGDGQDQRDNLEAGISVFNGKFLYNRMKASPGENIITSPCSVITLLAQLALYAIGDSWKQLTSVLNLTSKQDIRKTIPSWADSFNGQTSVNFSTAAKVYCNQNYPLSDGFKKDSVDVVRADAQELDFSKIIEAAKIINAWVESKTNNLIKDLIAPSDLSASTRLVLVNAIYFKGDWQKPFNKNYTKEADFYLSDGKTKKTKLMFQEGYFNYGEIPEFNCSVLEIPYKGRNFSMIIVLPNEKDGVLRTAENLQDAANFDKVLGSTRSNKVKLYVPPFEINTSTDLATILKQAGVTKIFDPKDSGLSGILKKPEVIYVSKAIQKAFIRVNETGSEATAANAIVVGVTSAMIPPRNIVFRCDRSFLYYIAFRRTVLFSGALVNPN